MDEGGEGRELYTRYIYIYIIYIYIYIERERERRGEIKERGIERQRE